MEKFNIHFNQLHYLEYTDLIIAPVFVLIIFFVVNAYKTRMIRVNSPIQKFLLPALSLKVFGALVSAMVYQFYYTGGDTMDFYTDSSFIAGLFFERFEDFLGLMDYSPITSDPNMAQFNFLPFINDPATWTLVRIAALCDILAFDSYPGIGLYFSVFSLFASWKFFSLLSELYPIPLLRQKFAYCIFYIPSVVFWGSGVFKDTLTLSGLFLFTTSIYKLVIRRQFSPSNFIWAIIGFYLMVVIRKFYLVILVPCILLWFFGEFRDSIIKSRFLKTASFPILIGFSLIFIVFGLRNVLGGEGDLSKSELTTKAQGFQVYHGSLGGSAYDLGIEDYSTGSLIKAIPLGINVTFFRPYLWETHSFFQLITALQSLFFTIYTLRTLFRSGFSIFGTLASDPLMLFSLPFSLLYGFVTGFTSYNFGALDRYKIPALPLYMITLVLINYHNHNRTKEAF